MFGKTSKTGKKNGKLKNENWEQTQMEQNVEYNQISLPNTYLWAGDGNNIADKNRWTERMLRIHKKEIALVYPDLSKSEVPSTDVYGLKEGGLWIDQIELEEGITVQLKEANILETNVSYDEKTKREDKQSAGVVYFLANAGTITFDLTKVKGMEGMEGLDSQKELSVNLGMFQMTSTDGKDNVEISAYLKDSLMVKKKDTNRLIQLELVQGEYQKPAEGDGILKFADSYLNTTRGKVNMPKTTEIHFQKNTEEDRTKEHDRNNHTEESYSYKAFASSGFQLQNAEEKENDIGAQSAKAKIFGFAIELEELSINDSVGIMNARMGNMLWNNSVMKMEKV